MCPKGLGSIRFRKRNAEAEIRTRLDIHEPDGSAIVFRIHDL